VSALRESQAKGLASLYPCACSGAPKSVGWLHNHHASDVSAAFFAKPASSPEIREEPKKSHPDKGWLVKFP
jgi:hypothetical protein